MSDEPGQAVLAVINKVMQNRDAEKDPDGTAEQRRADVLPKPRSNCPHRSPSPARSSHRQAETPSRSMLCLHFMRGSQLIT
jgi:hypothetical protein